MPGGYSFCTSLVVHRCRERLAHHARESVVYCSLRSDKSTFPWRALGKRGSEAGRKGGKLPADAVIPSSKWLWITMSEDMVEASSSTTCETAVAQAQKGSGLRPCRTPAHGDHSNETRRKVSS